MYRNQRIGIIIAACVLVVLATIGLLELVTPNISLLASGGYSPLFGAGSSNNGSSDLLDPALLAYDPQRGNLANSLFDDPTEVAEPTATAYIAAEAGAGSGIVQLAVEPTVLRPRPISSPTPRSNGTAPTNRFGTPIPNAGAVPVDDVGGGANAPVAPVNPAPTTGTIGGGGGRRPTAVAGQPGATTPPISGAPVPSATRTPVPSATRTAVPGASSTPVPIATKTAVPSATSTTPPTKTPVPTNTPVPPTDTPVPPTETPRPPTRTPRPPTNTPVPTDPPPTDPPPTDPPPTDPPPTDPPPTDPPPTDPPPTDPPPTDPPPTDPPQPTDPPAPVIPTVVGALCPPACV